MAIETNVADIKRRFSEFLNRVALNRERIVIRRRGKRVAVMVPVDEAQLQETPGENSPRRGLIAAVGVWEEYEDFDGFLDDIERLRKRATGRDLDPLP